MLRVATAMSTDLASRKPLGRGFRADINALRALAVLAVVLFHFKTPLVRGGFVGVDIFFVISGFLMTKIIFSRLDSGSFTFGSFLKARVERIFPALLVVLTVLLLVGVLSVDPLTLDEIGKESLAAILFLSNFLFASQAGYFAGEAEQHWLLHTWSLSVEWQFYLLYPLFIIALKKLRISSRGIYVLIVASAIASFLLMVLFALKGSTYTKFAFFLLPTRAWEMLAGGIVAIAAARRNVDRREGVILTIAGMALIGVSLLCFDSYTLWPYWWTLAPVIGCAVIILADQDYRFWNSLPGVRQIGTWSYSIYIWHWPIIVGMRYFGAPTTGPWIGLGIAATVVVGGLSYRFIETDLRAWLFNNQHGRRPWLFGAALAALCCLCGTVIVGRGFEDRRAAELAASEKAALVDYRSALDDWNYPAACESTVKFGNLKLCEQGNSRGREVLVIGDSHAQQFAQRYATLSSGGEVGVTFATSAGCLPLPNINRRQAGYDCPTFTSEAYDLARHGGYKNIVFMSMWSGYFEQNSGEAASKDFCFVEGRKCVVERDRANYVRRVAETFSNFSKLIRELEKAGKHVTIVMPLPYDEVADPAVRYRQVYEGMGATLPKSIARRDFEERVAFSRSQLLAAGQAAGASIVDPLDTLCVNDQCPVMFAGRALYKDRTHIRASAAGSSLFAYLDQVLVP